MSAVTFGGLVSGLDTGSLIEKLVSAERSATTALTSKQSNLTAQKTIVGNLSTAVAALGTAARGMDLASELQPRAVSVSTAHVTAAVSSSAETVPHDIRVTSLAVAKVTSSKTYASDTAGIAGTGTVRITVNGTQKTVSFGSTDTLTGIASKINDADAGVNAAVLYDGSTYRLMVTAKATGTAAAPAFVDTGSSLGLSTAGNVKVAATNAVMTIDGVSVTRPTNVVTDALAGVTLTLNSVHATADPTSKLVVSTDTKALTEKVKSLVTAYNTVNSQIHAQLDYTGTTKGSNTLFGDSTLRQLQLALDRTMTSSYGTTNLSLLGITRDKTGAMTLDETKFAAAVSANPAAATGLFVTGGFANAVGTLADSYTTAGTGLFAAKTDSLSARGKVLQTQIDRIDAAADALQARLEKQFSALEQAMSSLQSQSSYLANNLKSI